MAKRNPIPPLERIRKLLSYDPKTGIFLRTGAYCASLEGKEAGALNYKGYVRIYIDGSFYMAHRIAWAMMNSSQDVPEHIDHENGNRSDNRWSNLRKCSNAENLWNREAQSNNKLGIKGVHFCNRKRKFIAKIMVHGKQIQLGEFFSKEEASAAYVGAAKLLHGDFLFPGLDKRK